MKAKLLYIIREKGILAGVIAVLRYFYVKGGLLGFQMKLQMFYWNTFCKGEVIRKVHGNIMHVDVKDPGICRHLLWRSAWETEQTALVEQIIKPGMVVLDIGANIGYYALIEAQLVGPSGKVYAVEPILSNFLRMERNIVSNRYQNIISAIPCAISSKSGIAQILETQEPDVSTMIFNKGLASDIAVRDRITIGAKRWLDVPTFTVDDFMGGREVDFIRMDVEGSEYEIVKGMDKTIRLSPDCWMFIEVHSSLFADRRCMVAEMVERLWSMGFEIKHILESNYIPATPVSFTKDTAIDIIASQGVSTVYLKREYRSVLVGERGKQWQT